MQRKATKNTRGPNADEKRFHAWLKGWNCCWCDNEGPSIVDHCRGSTFKHNKVLVGHWFCLPHCVSCDTQKTIHGKRLGNESEAWHRTLLTYQCEEAGGIIPDNVFSAIMDWNK